MDRDFLNEVKFTDVKIKKARPSKQTDNQPEGPSRKGTIRQAKVLRLIFFLVVVFALVWTVKYSLESVYSMCVKSEHKSMGQIYHEYKEYKAERGNR